MLEGDSLPMGWRFCWERSKPTHVLLGMPTSNGYLIAALTSCHADI